MRILFTLAVLCFLSACVPFFSAQQPRPDSLTFAPLEFNFPQVAKKSLHNGMRLYLKEDHELPLVEITLLVEGGDIYDPLEKTGLSQFFSKALSTGGTESLTPEQLEAELEAMAAILTVTSSAYGFEIDLSLNQKDLHRGVAILGDLLRRPRFDEKRLELIRGQMLEGIKRKNDDPGSIARRLLAGAVYSDHPFGAYPTADVISNISRDDLIDLYQRYFHPQNVWLAISGDVEAEELIPLFNNEFKTWSTRNSMIRQLPLLPDAPDGKVLLAQKEIPQTTILMGHPGINKDNPDAPALKVANYILGGGGFNSRMMREIRSNRGLAYSVYSYFQIGRQLKKMFIASSETKSDSTVEVVSLMLKLIEDMRDKPVSTEELELAKKSLVNSFVFAFSDSHSIVSRKVRLDYYGYAEGYLENYQRDIDSVTIADVQRVARKYLQPEQMQIVLVGNNQLYLDKIKNLGLPVVSIDLD